MPRVLQIILRIRGSACWTEAATHMPAVSGTFPRSRAHLERVTARSPQRALARASHSFDDYTTPSTTTPS